MIKYLLSAGSLFFTLGAGAQSIDSICINLYTDSLKKGTYNYINVDGHLSNGRFIPLDSTELIFKSSAGKFYGNSLWIDPHFQSDKISISVTSRKNSSLYKHFDMYIKKNPDNEQLKTVDELLRDMKPEKRKKRS